MASNILCDGTVSPTAADRQPQAEAKNAFKNKPLSKKL
ncbi:hypothetical protein GXM_10304 [Nostoc sphaeroides CCNUC1]|uniref:Uncharacterized protein n=1 Tax=Nostoc sphaeroides CCNUC1 TaxID=2653204 RepID=A0A5P8WL00_9NOSO|nr:hypothetical protein GXM_10304 [Nostoc sphaeroides CCNUC1]